MGGTGREGTERGKKGNEGDMTGKVMRRNTRGRR